MLETWRRRRMLQRVPELAATTPDGAVARTTGTVRAIHGASLIAPCSGRACLVYRVHLRLVTGGVHTRTFGEMVAFELATPIGTITIESKDALLVLPQIEQPPEGPRAPERAARWRELLIEQQVWDPHSVYAVLETIVAAGEVHTVAGVVEREAAHPEEQRTLRDSPPRLRLVGGRDQPLLIGNAPL